MSKKTPSEFQDFLDCIRIEISNDHYAESQVTVIKLEPDEIEELEAIKANLEVEGRTFEFDPSANKLKIDSSNCPTEE
jgi:hypothetical protein